MSKESLQALSQVNRKLNRMIVPILNEHLVVRLREETIDTWLCLPYPQTVLPHVKRLSIVAERCVSPSVSSHYTRASLSRRISKKFQRIRRDLQGATLGDKSVPVVGNYSRGDWTPVLNLIRQIPSLHNLNLFVKKGGPVELCETLSQYHPTCRVSIFTTWPFSGGYTPDSTIQKAWLLSPGLHAVHVRCTESPRTSKFIEHPDRVLQSIVLLAPHIKEIALQMGPSGHRGHESGFNERIEVKGTKNEKPPGPAKLETLSWPLNSKMTAGQFEEWQTITDFSLLESWTVGCIEDSALLQTIVDIHPFQHLTRLTLALFPSMEDDDGLRFWQAAESMFQSLPPLTYLALFGAYTSTFFTSSVIPQHGSTLLELKLHGYKQRGSQEQRRLEEKGQLGPIFPTNDILVLAGQCSSLQRLLICVQRYQGLETDTWTALGRFPRLKELTVLLNCLPIMGANRMPIPPRDLTDFEKSTLTWRPSNTECPKWFIRDCMINCTISEDMAKEFFTHIHACQHEKNLTKLVIHPLFGQSNQYSCFPSGATHAFIGPCFFNKLAPIWTVERDFLSVLHAEFEKRATLLFLTDAFPDEKLAIFESI